MRITIVVDGEHSELDPMLTTLLHAAGSSLIRQVKVDLSPLCPHCSSPNTVVRQAPHGPQLKCHNCKRTRSMRLLDRPVMDPTRR